MSVRSVIVSVSALAWATACASSVPPPNDEWSAAQADVGRAQGGGAPTVPDAKLHLQLAEEDLAKSKQLIDTDNARATTLIALARVEAQLALSVTKATAAQDQVRSIQNDLAKVSQGGQPK